MVTDGEPTFYFDFIDPLSYLTELELEALGAASSASVRRIGFELRPPPEPLTIVEDPALAERWGEARSLARTMEGVALEPPALVPWTRKAHELHLFAASKERADAVRSGIYEAYFRLGRDIGRVDVLVDIAREVGLDATESKAALDVDRFAADVASLRSVARASGVRDTPAFVRGDARLEGFHNRTRLGTFLRES